MSSKSGPAEVPQITYGSDNASNFHHYECARAVEPFGFLDKAMLLGAKCLATQHWC